MGKNKRQGTVLDLGDVFADVFKHTSKKGGGYNITIVDKKGSRPDLGKIDVGNRDMLGEVLSWFTSK